LDGDVYRVFFSGRDKLNRSSVGAVDIDIVKLKIVSKFKTPFFQHGPENSFYSDGVSIGNCYKVNGIQYMLFMGWHTPLGQHWRGTIGRLVVTPEFNLILDSASPLIDLSSFDPISLSYPWVLPNPSGGYDMWYGSTCCWDAGNGEMKHVIKHAYSADGSHWNPTGLAVPYLLGRAQAFSRPSVILSKLGKYEMWFSVRGGCGDKYRIGHADGSSPSKWKLDLEFSAITTSESGWDSEMIEYPYVFDHNGKRYMLYNGNDYGKTGFGLAILNESI
jgi:hypothetical protein